MLLNMMCGRQLSAISLCLAVTFAPLFNAQADEPEVSWRQPGGCQ